MAGLAHLIHHPIPFCEFASPEAHPVFPVMDQVTGPAGPGFGWSLSEKILGTRRKDIHIMVCHCHI